MSTELHLVVVHEDQVPTYLDKGYWIHDRPLSDVMNEKVLALLDREERAALRLMAVDKEERQKQNSPPRRYKTVYVTQDYVEDADVHELDLLDEVPPCPGLVMVNDRATDTTFEENPNRLHMTVQEAIRASAGTVRQCIARHRQAIEYLEAFLRRAEEP